MLKLDHVVFPVRDAERTLAFYRDFLRLPLVAAHSGDDWDGYPWLMMIFGLKGGQELVTVALEGAPAPDYRGVPMDARHYALAASEPGQIDEWRARLTAAGHDFWEESHGDQASLYFSDPDGIILEVTWPPTKALSMESAGALAAARSWIDRTKAPA